MVANIVDVVLIKAAIVDDDEGIRPSHAARIRRIQNFGLTGDYPDAETALQEISRRLSDVVLIDINLAGMNGMECVRQLKAVLSSWQDLMLTVYEDSDSRFNSLKAGASGYLLKGTASERLPEAIRDVYDCGSSMTPQLARPGGAVFFPTRRGGLAGLEIHARRKGISRSTRER